MGAFRYRKGIGEIVTENVPTQGETPTQPETETGTAPAAQAPTGETPADVQALIDQAVTAATKKANHEAAQFRKKLEALEAAERQRQEAQLSEQEKLAKRAAELEAEVSRLRLEGLRTQAANKHGLPAELAARLKGETPDEIDQDAEAIAKLLPKARPNVSPTNPGGAVQGETEDQRRARIYGYGGQMFDSSFNAKMGGGVTHTDKEQ